MYWLGTKKHKVQFLVRVLFLMTLLTHSSQEEYRASLTSKDGVEEMMFLYSPLISPDLMYLEKNNPQISDSQTKGTERSEAGEERPKQGSH